ncbi:polyketide synthase 1 [Trichoderma asperellum]|uniref:Polyketide synthase 1 n=1 Tax=Trichoderma asperellum TaxID=101201 RepID=A0A6V8R7H5_TRIAP|nr:polyketide synthase 1 [Trichoderma asperellum]
MSGRFPEAADVEEFWNLLYQGLDVHRRVPEDRYNAELYYDASGKRKNTSKIMHGCWINEPGLFDAKFFNISPKEAEQSDPGQRLALVTAYEALEMAGVVADRTPSTQRDRVGVFYGMTSDDYREVSCGQNVDTYFIPGGNRAFTPGKVNYFFKYCGPSVSVDTACSSSLAAIHLACNSIWRNECDMAIAGGTNVMSNPDSFAGLDRGHFLSRTGNCNTFDDAADGYCRADAVGTVVLKRLEDAIADHDPILGVILGAHTNHSAESVSITRPHCGAQEEIFSKLLTESGVPPNQVSYIEMHGTGTQAGDATEMASVLSCFAPSTTRLSHESLYLGSAKANVGHSESASGVTALIKVLLMMEKNIIPPHCGIKGKINHKFPTDLEERNVHIAMTPTRWDRLDEFNNIRRAFVNNFSAAGGNTALIMEDYPELTMNPSRPDLRTAHLVTISAKSIPSLRGNLEKLRNFVKQQTGADDFLSKLSYTTTARRMHHPFRVAIPAANCEQLLSALNDDIKRDAHKRSEETPVAFVFSGQGSQYSGIGQHLLHYATFRKEIESYDILAQRHGFPSIMPVVNGSVDIDDLEPLIVQLGTTCVQMALASFWVSLGLRPVYVVGHSLGHYAALKVAGVLTASDTIYLVGMRARLLQEKCSRGSHEMLAIRSSVDQIQKYLDAKIHDVACINGPQDTVVSGRVDDIENLSQKLAASNIKATRVNVPFAFHSAQVDPILDQLESIASNLTFHSPRIPLGCPLLGKTFLAECEFTSEKLHEVVFGHVVNGNRVCTSSLYTDFGVTLGTLVDYSNAYKGIQEAIVNAEDFEATGLVRFQVDEGSFQCNPMWVDSCGQLAGFLMNGHAKTPKDQVFINHGWKSFRAVRKFSKDKTYRTYVRMRPIEGTMYAGDVYIFDDEDIVAVCGDIKFQGISRKVLNNAMPPPKSANEGQPRSRPAPVKEIPATNTATVSLSPISRHTEIEPLKLDAALKSASAVSAARDPMHSILKILSEEIGIALASVQDDFVFADNGVDSLLSLKISGRFREELGLDLESSVFETCATVADLVAHLGYSTFSSDQSTDHSSVAEGVSATSDPVGTLTSSATTPPPRSLRESVSSSLCKDVCAILAEEIGVSTSEIMNDANLGELGMDSLMSLTVLGRLREELELELDDDFFVSYPDFSSFKLMFQPALPHEIEPDMSEELKQYRATSILLQGNPKTALYTLFLLPDGSGAAVSYGPINTVGKDVCVYGLNCPWLKSANKLVQFGLKGLASLYIEEIQRRVPHGPYNLGGWSAGGICAYEAAIQLTRQGETVDRLIFLDSPNPIGLEKLPARLFDFINGLGLFGDGKAPDWLLEHFLAFIDALDEWKPVPWSEALDNKTPPPRTYILWAEDGVCKGIDERPEYRDDDPREMRWLLENRTNFGGNNWDVLLGERNLSIERIKDANHFTMLHKGKNTERVAAFIKNAFT